MLLRIRTMKRLMDRLPPTTTRASIRCHQNGRFLAQPGGLQMVSMIRMALPDGSPNRRGPFLRGSGGVEVCRPLDADAGQGRMSSGF